MALHLDKKKCIVQNLNAVALQASSAVITDFSGISVERMNGVRRLGFEKNVKVFVLQNRLTKKALVNTPFEFLIPHLQGPCLCAFSMSHPREGALLFQGVAKKEKIGTLKGAAFEGQYLPSEKGVTWLSQLPTRDEALSRLLGLLKELCGAKLARTLVALQQKLEG